MKKTFLLLSVVGALLGGCSKEQIVEISPTGNPRANEIYYTTSDGKYLDLESRDWYKTSVKSHRRANDSIFILNFIQDISEIESYAFTDCNSLKSITIPNSVKEIGEGAFHNCSSLKSFTIPEGVTIINFATFNSCTSLTNITIPNSVKEIEGLAFACCESLTNLTLPEGLTIIGYKCFADISIENLTIPQSVSSFKNNAFSSFQGTNITIPENLNIKEIPHECFWLCGNLTNITIPKSVEKIEFRAYLGCASIEEITIPEKVTEIGWEAFYSCDKLRKVYCKSLVPPSITPPSHISYKDYKNPDPLFSNYDFGRLDKDFKIYVPSESVSDYKSAWKDFARYIEGYNFD